jgi:hypothetical protein
MTEELKLGQLDIGKEDCKNELLSYNGKKKEKFQSSFLLPENVDIDKFLEPTKFEYYFIKGLKGVGKTSLLRYIGLQIDTKTEGWLKYSYSSLILFKDFRDDRLEIAKLADNITRFQEDELKRTRIPDYTLLWDFFIHKHIVMTIERKNINIFKNDVYWESYYACVKSTIFKDEIHIIPKFLKGLIEVSAEFPTIFANLHIKIHLPDKTKEENLNLRNEKILVKFEELVTNMNRLFKSLTHAKDYLYILFDELELSPFPHKAHVRDSRFIRDLISTIERFNAIARGQNGGVFLIAAIRIEVLDSLEAIGREINRLCRDQAIEISWTNKNKDLRKHPILKILEKRIQAAEIAYDGKIHTPDVWQGYFPEKIDGIEARKFILFQTWYKPRDIIRLLSIAQESYPLENMFSQEVFDSVLKKYSKESWMEISEELRNQYNTRELDIIRKLFFGYERDFTFLQLSKHIEKQRMRNVEIDRFFHKHKLENFLDDLYNVGILGNSWWSDNKKHYDFVYTGSPNIIRNKKIIVHRGLWPYLGIG